MKYPAMPDPTTVWADRLVAEAATLSASEAARHLIDHYRVARLNGQLAIVIALIAEVITLRMRARTPKPDAAA